jgi:putative DNA primase/helicase
MATLDDVRRQMLAQDMEPPTELRVDGRYHRFGPRAKCWYVLREFLARSGKRVIVGAFGRWQGTDNGAMKVESDFGGVDQEELERLRRSQAEVEQRAAAKEAQRAKFAALRALAQYNAPTSRAQPPAEWVCPYLKRKSVEFERPLRLQADGTLLVPMVRYDVTDEQAQDPAYDGPPRLAGLQKIAPDGDKKFNRGMKKAGTAVRFGNKPRDGQLILIAEGVATGLTIRAASERKYPVVVAFDAGNLAPVARLLRALYPRSPLLLCADDDAYLEAQLNKRLAEDYGVQTLYRVAMGPTQLMGRDDAVIGITAELQRDPAGVEGLTAAIAVGEKTRPLAFVNTGRLKARAAAEEVGNARVWRPVFAARVLSPDPAAPQLTDYNDLHQAEGLARVSEQLGAAIAAMLGEAGASGDEAPAGEDSAAAAPAAAGNARASDASGGGAGGGTDDPPDWHLYRALLDRFTLVYPSNEAFDGLLGRLVKLDHMRNMFGKRYVGMWLGSEKKRVVYDTDVVFDPEGRCDPKKTVNLFRGIHLKPDAGKACERWLAMLQYLCGEEDRDQAPVTDWVLRWLAYPLQHLGAKMNTAVVMYGDEGTGKNMLAKAMQRIYGEHGVMITQQQLNSQFNGWLSAKLFVVANEVVTRQEMTHYVGLLKTLITEPEIQIERKGVDARTESNHANLMFFSNELQPLKIMPRDRRYMVIRTPKPKPKEYYKAVGEELAAGGAEGLYAYLLALDLAEFDQYTEPLFTDAKRDLIEIGMSAAELFWQDLHDGTLGLPYGPAQVSDVYRAYMRWCFLNGQKNPAMVNRFIPDFMRLNGVSRRAMDIPPPERPIEVDRFIQGELAVLKQRRILVMGDPDPDPDLERHRIVRACADFHAALRTYARGEQQDEHGGEPVAKPATQPEAPL